MKRNGIGQDKQTEQKKVKGEERETHMDTETCSHTQESHEILCPNTMYRQRTSKVKKLS